MNSMASPTTSNTDTYEQPEVTWRDALTPLSRTSRRRWTACYVLLLIGFALEAFPDTLGAGLSREQGAVSLLTVIALIIVFGMLRRGTRRIAALDHPELDERDIEARNSAYRIAFPLLLAVIAVVLVLLVTLTPGAEHELRLAPNELETTSGRFVGANAMFWAGIWIVLWAVFLPTGVLAWREPDAVDLEQPHALPEPIRDAIVGASLAAAYALNSLLQGDAGSFLFGAIVALLGGLSRRRAGQPIMSRQRKWRIAIGIALILIMVAVAIAVQTSMSTHVTVGS